MSETVRFRKIPGQDIPPDFKQWAMANLDEGEYSFAYDIITSRYLYRKHDGDTVCDGFVLEEDIR